MDVLYAIYFVMICEKHSVLSFQMMCEFYLKMPVQSGQFLVSYNSRNVM
uniref:Uncharacterized protein n=1 Tax=Anguilla anguilla TaxID=7936 RepID=A0A0E9SPE5_ANGAN